MNIFERRKLTLFIASLSAAILAWLFFAFSSKYVYQYGAVVRYINSPQDKTFHPLQSDSVYMQVEGTGWQLIFSRLRIFPSNVAVDLKSLNTKSYVSLSDQLEKINRQLSIDQRIVSISPDTLYFDFSATSVKKVPIKLSYDFEYEGRHNLAGVPEIVPAYVTIMGPAHDLELIDYWLTDSLKRTDLKTSFSTRIYLKRSPKNNLNISPRTVNVTVPIDEFTEMHVDIPVRVVNNKGYDVKLLPEKVRLTYLTALSNYNKFDSQSISVTVDLNNWETKGYKQLPVKLSGFPEFYKLISIQPQIVDFIIQ